MATRKLSPFRLTALLRHEQDPHRALRLFLHPFPTPSSTPFPYSAQSFDILLCKLARARLFPELSQILRLLRLHTKSRNLSPKEPLFCHLLSSYARSNLPDHALALFRQIPSFNLKPSIKSFNSLLNAMLVCGRLRTLADLCRNLDLAPDPCTYNVVINACFSVGAFGDARDLFDEMFKRGIGPNEATFGTMVSGLCRGLKVEEALELKDEMERIYKVKPNVVVYTSLIKAVCGLRNFDLALELKEEGRRRGVELDRGVFNTLIRGAFRVGRREVVVGLLEEMRERGLGCDRVSYNAMIAGFCEEGDFKAAFGVLDEMGKDGFKPDVVGYNVVIGGLCRVGKWHEANDVFENMPRKGCSPDVVSYRTLLGGLCGGMMFDEAVFLLDEMVFKGFKPHAGSVCRIVEGVKGERREDLLVRVVESLAKGNGVDSCVWKAVCCAVCEKVELQKVFDLVNDLMLP